MSSIYDLGGTSSNSFSLNNKASILQGDDEPIYYLGKNGDLYLQSNGVIWSKRENKWSSVESGWTNLPRPEKNYQYMRLKNNTTGYEIEYVDGYTAQEIDNKFNVVDIHLSNVDDEISSLNEKVNTNITSMLNTLYPIGSVYIGTQSTCPMTTLIPNSQWVLIDSNRALWSGDGTNGGTIINAGLPNITGTVTSARGASNSTTSGALKYTDDGKTQDGGDGGDGEVILGGTLSFNASNSNSIYGSSSTVQPPAYVVNVWKRIEDLAYKTFTINPTPTDATVVLTAEGYTQSGNSITVLPGTTVSYKVSKDGYDDASDTKVINDNITLDVNLSIHKIDYKLGDRIGNIATIVGNYTDSDNKVYAFAILDAKYRVANKTWSSKTSVDTSLTNYSKASIPSDVKESATYNTDTILNNYTSTEYPAFNTARNSASVTIGSKTYYTQLPNAYELQLIYENKETLDTYDTTLSSYPSYNLTNWYFGSSSCNYSWASNETSSSTAWCLKSDGSWVATFKNTDLTCGVMPIIEIQLS